MKKQRKTKRLKRKHLKAAFNVIQFGVVDDPMNCGIIVDAKVKIVMP